MFSGNHPAGGGVKCRLGEWPETATASEFSSVTAARALRKASLSSSCDAIILRVKWVRGFFGGG